MALAVVGTLIVAGLAGFAIGRSTAPEPTLSEQITDLRDDLRPASQAYEFMPTEYAQAVRGGKVVREAEYKGVQGSLDRAGSAIEGAQSDLRSLDPERAAAVTRTLATLRAAVERRADAAQVRGLALAAAQAVDAATGG